MGLEPISNQIFGSVTITYLIIIFLFIEADIVLPISVEKKISSLKINSAWSLTAGSSNGHNK